MTFHRKVTVGDRVPSASQYARDVMDGARWAKETYFGEAKPNLDQAMLLYKPMGIECKIKNLATTGGALKMFSILGLRQEVVVDYDKNNWEFLRNVTLVGELPHKTTHKNNFVITTSPIGVPTVQDGSLRIGRCCVSGIVPVRVNIKDVDHRFAAIIEEEGQVEENYHNWLESVASDGVQIIYSPRKLGVQWCFVRIGAAGAGGGAVTDQASFIEFTLDQDMAVTDNSASATVTQIYDGSKPSIGGTETVWNTCNDFGGTTGTCGAAKWNDTDQRYQIVVMWEKYARFIEFTVDADFEKTDNFFAVTQGAYWDGIAPAPPVTQVVNTGNNFKGYAGWKGIARYDYYDAEYQAVYVTHNWALRWIEFDTTTEFGTGDAGPHTVNVTGYYNGLDPGATVDVMNTKGIFRSNGAGFGGVATEEEDGTWKLVQLKCEPPSRQSAGTSTETLYSTGGTQIPLDALVHSSGDLITINASDEVVFNRAARGALQLNLQAYWEPMTKESGRDKPDISEVYMEVDYGEGSGWEPYALGLTMSHQLMNVADDYLSGGIAYRSGWTSSIVPAGTKMRFFVRTLNTEDNQTLRLSAFSFEVLETYDTPLAP